MSRKEEVARGGASSGRGFPPFLFLIEQVRRVRPLVAMGIAFLLLLALDQQIRRLENVPDLALRNEDRAQVVLPYFLARLHRAKPSVVFLGASILQGVTNTLPRDTAPILIQESLRGAGRRIHVFNTATMGNNLGDQLAITRAVVRNGADALVLSLHYKLFSPHSVVGNPLRYRDLAFYLRGEKKLRHLLRDSFQMRRREWFAVLLRGNLRNVWGLYRYRGLITFRLTGSMDDPLQQFQDYYARRLGIMVEGAVGRNVMRRFDPEDRDRDRDRLWEDMIDFAHDAERDVYAQINLENNPHLDILILWADMVRLAARPALAYFTPKNWELIERESYFSRERHEAFQKTVRGVLEARGIKVVDFSDAVPSENFTDADHLTRTGHRILAAALEPLVSKLLDEAPGK